MDLISEIAKKEVEEEIYREKIEAQKVIIREKIKGKRWWHKLIPFIIKIKIERR